VNNTRTNKTARNFHYHAILSSIWWLIHVDRVCRPVVALAACAMGIRCRPSWAASSFAVALAVLHVLRQVAVEAFRPEPTGGAGLRIMMVGDSFAPRFNWRWTRDRFRARVRRVPVAAARQPRRTHPALIIASRCSCPNPPRVGPHPPRPHVHEERASARGALRRSRASHPGQAVGEGPRDAPADASVATAPPGCCCWGAAVLPASVHHAALWSTCSGRSTPSGRSEGGLGGGGRWWQSPALTPRPFRPAPAPAVLCTCGMRLQSPCAVPGCGAGRGGRAALLAALRRTSSPPCSRLCSFPRHPDGPEPPTSRHSRHHLRRCWPGDPPRSWGPRSRAWACTRRASGSLCSATWGPRGPAPRPWRDR